MSYRLIAAAAAVIALQGCANKPAPPSPAASEDLNVGIAKSCTFSPVQPVPGGTANATMSMTNDGWCAVRTTESAGQPFLLGLVLHRPDHGELQIRKLGGETRIEYEPNAGFVGADAFTVSLRPNQQGAADAQVQVAVTVTRGEGVAAAPEPTPAAKPAATKKRAPVRHPVRKTTSKTTTTTH